MVSLTDIQSDLNELQSLRTKAERSNVQKLLDNEIQRLTSELKKQSKPESRTPTQSTSTNTRGVNRPVKKLKSFAYDESDKFVKLYYTLPGVQNLPSDSINASFTEDSFNIKVVDLNGVDYTFEAAGFTHPIDASKSLAKQKTDSVLVMLKKLKDGTQWQKLLKLEKASKIDMPEIDESGDPQQSLMSMMKKLYDEGDEQMKQTITKAFYESEQKKKTQGGDGDLNF
ncbi:Calcyclin-binding protein [Aphelenchoides besseyi]|nr:Calcyclin-binding protein [Aphelenchoides besseyi]